MYRDALRTMRDLGLDWDEALCSVDMATLLGPADPEVRAAAERAREILARLGAKPLLERLEAALAGAAGPAVAKPVVRRAEVEVRTATDVP